MSSDRDCLAHCATERSAVPETGERRPHRASVRKATQGQRKAPTPNSRVLEEANADEAPCGSINNTLLESGADCPMLQPVRKAPGVAAVTFSPNEFFELTHAPRLDLDPEDDDLFLTEEPVKTVHKNGIALGDEIYFHPALLPFVSGPKGAPRPNLVVRYDRALFARGVLDEIRVLEQTQGGYTEICRCRLRSAALGDIDPDAFLRERHVRERQLTAKVRGARGELLTLERGRQVAADLRAQRAERVRWQKAQKWAPRVAEPITRDSHDAEQDQLQRDLIERVGERVGSTRTDEGARRRPSGAESNGGAAPPAKTNARKRRRRRDAEAADGCLSSGESVSLGLGAATSQQTGREPSLANALQRTLARVRSKVRQPDGPAPEPEPLTQRKPMRDASGIGAMLAEIHRPTTVDTSTDVDTTSSAAVPAAEDSWPAPGAAPKP